MGAFAGRVEKKKATHSMNFPLFLALSLFLGVTTAAIQCQTSSGEKDWWFSYKMPAGAKYAYSDSESELQQMGSLTDSSNPLRATLDQIYPLDEHPHIMYNDEPIGISPNDARGHTKGVLAWDGDTGFWLLHSIPNFPDIGSSYDYPGKSSETYAQSMLCMSFSASELSVISRQLQFNQPLVYSSNLKDGGNAASLLSSLVSGHFQMSGGNSVQLNFKSLAGKTFTMFNKNANFGKDLYADLVQRALGVDMFVETWIRAPKLPSFCTSEGYSYNTWNVVSMNVDGVAFKETQDHAKIAISADSSSPYVCVGGINRMSSQYKRGGGTTCISDPTFYSGMRKSVVEYDNCGTIVTAVETGGSEQGSSVVLYLSLACAVAVLTIAALFLVRLASVPSAAEPSPVESDSTHDYSKMGDVSC